MGIETEPAVDPNLYRPSGEILPPLLRNRGTGETSSKQDKDNTDDRQKSPEHRESVANRNAVFTSEELQNQLWRASVAMIDIQKQLYRGEESYHEETHSWGNLFRGFDDAIGAMQPEQASGGGFTGRRLHADSRWFSGSCPSVGRTKKPTPPIMATKAAPVTAVTPTSTLSSSAHSTKPVNQTQNEPPSEPINDNKDTIADKVSSAPPDTATNAQAVPASSQDTPAENSTKAQNETETPKKMEIDVPTKKEAPPDAPATEEKKTAATPTTKEPAKTEGSGRRTKRKRKSVDA